MRTTMTATVLAAIALASGVVLAIDPPGLMNYQGVLRDADDNPLDGTHDMIFRFYDDADPTDPENEILVDEHLASGTGAVTVTGGLFDVVLGSGQVSDGSGAGDHPTLYHVFAFHEPVYLEVQVGAEILQPRMQVVSAPYAMNSVLLGGSAPDQFINTSSEEQEKTGLLRASGGVDFGSGADDDLSAFDVATLTSGGSADALHTHMSVPSAGNADTLDMYDSTYFLNTSSTPQSKSGPLVVDAVGAGYTGFEAVGDGIGGFLSNNSGDGSANVAIGNRGVEGFGSDMGGYFKDSDGSGEARLGFGNYGIKAEGQGGGGHFVDTDSSGQAYLATGDVGVEAEGDDAGGVFRTYYSDTLFAEAKLAHRGGQDPFYRFYGIHAKGADGGGYFESWQTGPGGLPESSVTLAHGPSGLVAEGTMRGGSFASELDGVWSEGGRSAGVFYNTTGGGTAIAILGDYSEFLGPPLHFGIRAEGSRSGGYFQNADGTAYAELAIEDYGGTGVEAKGSDYGGRFFHDSGSVATLGNPEYGIRASGPTAAGHFSNLPNTGTAQLAYGDDGIYAEGNHSGGYFYNDTGLAWAEIAYNELGTGYKYGVAAFGQYTGGLFADYGESGYALVGHGTSKIVGSGAVSFVQNHPHDPSQVIVYTAPEGDEVATYTRGTARLENGEARVALGETFAWVTNPDIGLTAHVTPRSADAVVYVESISTEELVVRNVAGFPADAVFDYLVYGLRIGFEERTVVRPKERESYIPSMAGERAVYEQAPELRSYNALERFKAMYSATSLADADTLDMSASRALRDAIHEYDPATDPPVDELLGHGPGRQSVEGRSATPSPTVVEDVRETDPPVDSSLVARDVSLRGDEPESRLVGDETFPVGEPVEAGDLLTLDPERAGVLVRATTAQDPGVVGIAGGESDTVDGELRVALQPDFAVLKVDAGYGEIRPGDLLTSSFTPGHAMRAAEIVPGTIVGKALEPLETGTGSIKVLVMPR